MNNFLELHSSADYRNTNRPYYTGTWEPIAVASDYLIPFQWTNTVSSDISFYHIDTSGNETGVRDHFISATNLITGWTDSGVGLSSTGALINSWSPGNGDYITSNTFTLTAGRAQRLSIDTSDFEDQATSNYTIQFYKGAVKLSETTLDNVDVTFGQPGYVYCEATTTGADYTFRIVAAATGGTVTANTPKIAASTIHKSGNYQWYDGGPLYDTWPSGIYRLRVMGSSTLYSDWMDTCGFNDKLKFAVSSSYDYGSIKYVNGYEQWIYKDASVRRNPSAEIEITAEQRNGVRIDEKKISAVRYKTKMKVTESEYEAFVHAAMGTVVITDYTGKSYTCTSIEMTEPTWYRGNGILELSFIDENNINVWSRNNSDL